MSGQRRLVSWLGWLTAGLALAGLVAALVLWGPSLYRLIADQERVRGWLEGFGPWGPAAIIGLEIAQVLLAPIPGQAIGAASGYLYGPWVGLLYTMVGLIVGSLVGFVLVRRVGRPLLYRLLSPETLKRLDGLAQRGGALFFFLLWLLPFTPDDLACLAAALTPMPIRQFLLLMTVARLPGVSVSVWVGANVARLSPTAWLLLIIALACAAVIIWRWGERIQTAALRTLERLMAHPRQR